VCRGIPDGMALCHLPFGPTAYFGIHNCVLRHDIGSKQEVGTISEVYPNLIFDNFSTKLGARFQTILKALFPVPKPSNKRIVTFSNRNDYISFRCDNSLPPVLGLLHRLDIVYTECTRMPQVHGHERSVPRSSCKPGACDLQAPCIYHA
jgi:hypothetical protein